MRAAITLSATSTRKIPHDFLRHPYIPFVEQFGLTPVLVPNVIADPRAYATALGVEMLILTGGGDIEPARYGQAPHPATDHIAPRRDDTEAALLALALERDWPVLGICRGIQFLNVYFGGGVVQDIPAQIDGALNHSDAALTHRVTLTDPRVRDRLGVAHMATNTHHHQAITPDMLAAGLDVFAVSERDGVIEGVLHRTRPVLGVQWHPERPTPSAPYDRLLVRGLLERVWWA